jgi:acetyl-CoA carboxylase biotin carboxyl carrier protein
MKFVDVDVKKLFQLMQEHDISEVNLRDGEISVEVKRNRENKFFVPDSNKNINSSNLVTDENQKVKNDVGSLNEKSSVQEQEDEDIYLVKAPLVGTFYKASDPDSDPCVEVGDKVKKGDVLCIVEAMKSMNEIQSDVSGEIKEVCMKNTELVEFGQVLFKIDPWLQKWLTNPFV